MGFAVVSLWLAGTFNGLTGSFIGLKNASAGLLGEL